MATFEKFCRLVACSRLKLQNQEPACASNGLTLILQRNFSGKSQALFNAQFLAVEEFLYLKKTIVLYAFFEGEFFGEK